MMNEFVIVGGGVHGTYLANRLLESHAPEEVVVVDPEPQLLAAFRRRGAACGMTALRSPFVHHLARDPFDLETFAESRAREGELVPTPDYPPRPTLELFCDHAECVIERRGIDECHLQARVTAVEDTDDGLAVETTDGLLTARNVVLAVGPGRPALPEWATDGVEHVWTDAAETREPSSPRVAVDGGRPAGETVVVGGGITAAQAALKLDADVLLTRHPLRTAVTEADPQWINWSHIETRLHTHPPGFRARLETVREARNDGTMLPSTRAELADSGVSVERGEVESAIPCGGGVTLRLADGRTIPAARVRCATGFEAAWNRPFLGRLAEELGLERGAEGVPVLDDGTLAWRGATDGIYVSGALAACTVGPFAGTVIGARRAADRITESVR